MKRIFLLCLFLSTTFAGMMAQNSSQKPSVLYAEALDLFMKEKFAVAQHLFDQYILAFGDVGTAGEAGWDGSGD